jgi:Flp pilus assembly pilin Flp
MNVWRGKMKSLVKDFIKEEDGIATVEIVIIIAILVALALLFRAKIASFINNIFSTGIDGKKTNITETLPTN